jgi:hypothetical protein
MNFNLHSIVDAITNSSSEIYTFTNNNAISQVKKALRSFLDLLGINDPVDELFEVSIKYTFTENDVKILEVVTTDSEVNKINDRISEIINDDGNPSPTISITVKGMNGKEIDFMRLVDNITHSEEISC